MYTMTNLKDKELSQITGGFSFSVSFTHLTPPASGLVEISVVAPSFKKKKPKILYVCLVLHTTLSASHSTSI